MSPGRPAGAPPGITSSTGSTATELDNLVLLCYRHHHLVHEGGWQIVKTDDGRFLAVPPRDFIEVAAKGPD